MSGFFKKALGAFVEFEEGAAPTGDVSDAAAAGDPDAILATLKAAGISSGDAPAPAPSAASTPAPTIPAASTPSGQIGEVNFDAIYAAANVPPSAKTAPQLLSILDGLANMPPEMQKTTVAAIDTAEDHWSITDVVLDAQLRIQALEAAKNGQAETLMDVVAKAHRDTAARDEFINEATQAIKEQIALLEQELATTVAEATQEKAQIAAQVEASRQTAGRNQALLDQEASRLQKIITLFGADVDTAPANNK